MAVGFAGLGEMGAPIAAHIQRAGFSLHVHNRTAARMQPLCALGATACDTPRELAAQVDVVLLCLFDADATDAMLFDNNGLLQSARPGQLVVDLSTSPPLHPHAHATLRRACERTASAGWTHRSPAALKARSPVRSR
nr:NAD(P)-binding domain-containing protein [Hydrogenophaga palleronii]